MLRRRPREPLIETVLAESGRIRLLDRHLLRLRRSGASAGQITAVRALAETWRRTASSPVVVRFDVAAGAGVASTPRAPGPADPVRLATVSGYDPADATREQKRAERTWARTAEAQAVALGADAPLLVSGNGLVGEVTWATLFLVDDAGRIATPPARGLLPGVTRGWVLDAAGATEAALTRDDLASARAAFVTTAGRGVVPVAAIDGRALAQDPAVAELSARWRAIP